jgi:hypothetical protein
MINKYFYISITICLLLSSLGSPLLAHRGGQDAYGGHNERATGTYHFHSGPLAGQTFSSKAEAIQAINTVGGTHQTETNLNDNRELIFVGSIKSNKYHYPSCQWAKKIHPNNLITFPSARDAQSKGYVPCKVCHPPE